MTDSPAESTTKQMGAPEREELSLRRLWAMFLPLSLSDVLMSVAGPIIAAGLTRLADPQTNLAAYGVAESMAILTEAPIIMLLHASTTLSHTRQGFLLLHRFMLLANLAVTLVHGLIAFTPLYDLVFRGLLGLPEAVADTARPAFQLLLLWPAAIGWRRVFQGLLIYHKHSAEVGWASISRLASLSIVVLAGVLAGWNGAVVAALALSAGVLMEAAAVTFFSRRLLQTGEVWAAPAPDATGNGAIVENLGGVFHFYWPLAVTATLIILTRPLISAGLARTAEPELALAAWPVVWSSVIFLANGTRMVQQLSLAHVVDARSFHVLRRFTVIVGLTFTAALAALVWSPAGPAYLTAALGLDPATAGAALPGLRILALQPLAIAAQQWLQSHLIRDGRTKAVNLAALINGTTLLAVLFSLVDYWPWAGTALASTAVLGGMLVELVVLYRLTRPQVDRLLRG